jgi:L-aspartate oxidase
VSSHTTTSGAPSARRAAADQGAWIPRSLITLDPKGSAPVDADVLVVGSGVAGLSLALALPPGVRVLLATKGPLSEGATRYAQGGIAAVLPGSGDAAEAHQDDTLAAGAGLSDPSAARVLVEEAAAAITELLALGVRFDTDGGRLARTREGGHSVPRVVHAGGDATGAELERALIAQVRTAAHVHVREHAFLVDLLTDPSGAVTGAVLAHGGTLQVVRAGAVVLASGGAGQLYPDTTNPPAATGDGIAAALRAGAALADVEFVQFHPTALHLPGDPRLLLTEAMRGEGAVLRDPTGDLVMRGVHPLGDLAPRDVVSRGMATRMAALGCDHLLLDATGLGAERLARRFPTIVAACRAAGLDPATEPLPVSPAAHYLMGGVRTDLHGRASLPGLWAVGEAACTGVHGANRLASNSLLEGIVFAARIGRAIAAGPAPPGDGSAWPAVGADGAPPLDGAGGDGAPADPAAARAALRRLLTVRAGVVRSGTGLAEAAGALAGLPAAFPARPDGWEVANLVQLATVLVEVAARRQESRGAHWREDFPEPVPAWRVRQTVRRTPDGTLATAVLPVSGPVDRGATASLLEPPGPPRAEVAG